MKIPTFTTPKRTKKMLAVTAIAYPGNSYLTNRNVRDYTKVYYISDLLDQYNSSTSDKYFLEVAGDYFSQIDISQVAPPEYNELKTSLESIERQIDQKKRTLNRYSSREVSNYNKLIDKQIILVNKLNNMHLESRCITSIGGGIELRPSEFKLISRNRNSLKLREIAKIKSKIKMVGKIAKSGNWIRSNAGIGGSRINKLPVNSWKSAKSINGKIEYRFSSNSGEFATVTLYPKLNEWQSNISVNGSHYMVRYSKGENLLYVKQAGFTHEYRGKVLSNGKRVVFYQ